VNERRRRVIPAAEQRAEDSLAEFSGGLLVKDLAVEVTSIGAPSRGSVAVTAPSATWTRSASRGGAGSAAWRSALPPRHGSSGSAVGILSSLSGRGTAAAARSLR
jgi:hypothetical protein